MQLQKKIKLALGGRVEYYSMPQGKFLNGVRIYPTAPFRVRCNTSLMFEQSIVGLITEFYFRQQVT